MIVKFVDLKKEFLSIKPEIDKAIKKVIYSGNFILGNQVDGFEKEWASYLGVKHAISVASGTDALFLSLKALGIGPGDEVIVPSFTFISTVSSVTHVGATPILIDSPDNFLVSSKGVENSISKKTKAIIIVHLYGMPADMKHILKIAKKHKLYIIEDSAQAHGAKYRGKLVGTMGDLGCFSFYPTKNLGSYGDGGAVVTNNSSLAKKISKLKNYGQSSKYFSDSDGYNSRLDEIQAAVLRVKLKHLDEWNIRRREIAAIYDSKLLGEIKRLKRDSYIEPSCHIYPIFIPNRDVVQKSLFNKGISTLIHYPVPVHLQKAYKDTKAKKKNFQTAVKASREEISLPIHPFMTDSEVSYVADSVNKIISSKTDKKINSKKENRQIYSGGAYQV